MDADKDSNIMILWDSNSCKSIFTTAACELNQHAEEPEVIFQSLWIFGEYWQSSKKRSRRGWHQMDNQILL